MRVLDINSSLDEMTKIILQKARYQKVVLCIDDTSDIKFIDLLTSRIERDVVLLKYYYNKNNINELHNMLNNGVRVVIYNVDIKRFYKLVNNDNYVLNIFIPQENFVFPYIACNESLYGDNLLVLNTNNYDYITLIMLYQFGLYKVWSTLLQGGNVDTSIFKNFDKIANGKIDFYSSLINEIKCLNPYISNEYQDLDIEQLPYYVYLRLCAVLNLLVNIGQHNEQYIDFYKTEKSSKDISKAYALIIQTDIIDTLKFNCPNLIKLNMIILTRIKILIKKYFNFKNINLNKLNKIIKNQSKLLNIDNLLYISYIFDVI